MEQLSYSVGAGVGASVKGAAGYRPLSTPCLRISGAKRRSAVVSGIFYGECPEALAAQLAAWGLPGQGSGGAGAAAILVPHGAWDLTGSIAAAAFASALGRPNPVKRVLLLGTVHHRSVEEGIYLSESAFFETPFGDCAVDLKMNQRLASSSALFRINDIPHLSDHCLEVPLPMVKFCFPGALIIPILVCGASRALISVLSEALRAAMEKHLKESLIIISSNVSSGKDHDAALSSSKEFCLLLEEMHGERLLPGLSSGRINACGSVPVGALFESGLLQGTRCSVQRLPECMFTEDGEVVFHGAFSWG